MISLPQQFEKVWTQKSRYDHAEKLFYEKLAKSSKKNSIEKVNVDFIQAIHPKANEGRKVICDVGQFEKVWSQKSRYDLAERLYYEKLAKTKNNSKSNVDDITEQSLIPTESLIEETPINLVKNSEPNPMMNVIGKSVEIRSLETLEKLENNELIEHKNNQQIGNIKGKKNVEEQTISPENSPKLQKGSRVMKKYKQTNLSPSPKNKSTNVNTIPDIATVPHVIPCSGDEIENSFSHLRYEPVVSAIPISKDTDEPTPLITEFELTIKSDSKKMRTAKKDKKRKVKKLTTTTLNEETVNTNCTAELEEEIPKEKLEALAPVIPEPQVAADTLSEEPNPLIAEFEVSVKSPQKCKTVKKEKKKSVKKGCPHFNKIADEVAKAKEYIRNSMDCIDRVTSMTTNLITNDSSTRIENLEKENAQLKQRITETSQIVAKLEHRVAELEKCIGNQNKLNTTPSVVQSQAKPVPVLKPQVDEEDDGVDLFASDSEEEDAEAAKIKEQRLAEYAARKSKKPALIAKSNIILDVKPWDDETNMKEMETEVRKITADGLVWGASKLVLLAYGIHKLQISCVVEDDKVSVDWLQETIESITDYVQSVDIAAFNKV